MPETDELVEQIVAQVTANLVGLNQTGTEAEQRVRTQIEAQVASAVRDTVGSQLEGMAERMGTQATRIEGLEQMLAQVQDKVTDPAPAKAVNRTGVAEALNPHLHNPEALGAVLDGKFTYVDFCRAAINLRSGKVDPRLVLISEAGEIKADLSGEELPDGGALVPEEFRAQLLELMVDETAIRSRAFVMPLMSSTLTIPRIRDTDRSDGSLFGGVQTYWLEAGDEVPESQPEFAQVRLIAKALAALTEIQNTTIADSFLSVPTLITRLFSMAIRWKEELSFLRGNGAGRPLGILNAGSGAMISVARNVGTNNVDAEDIHAMEGRLLPGSDMRAVWMIHPGLRKDLGALNLGSVQYLQEDLSKRRPMMLNGRPVITCEHCSTPGTVGDIVLADWMYYLIGDRQAMSMASSPHPEFRKNATLVRAISRLDGQPWIDKPLTLSQGGSANSVSPFVNLAT